MSELSDEEMAWDGEEVGGEVSHQTTQSDK